MALFALWRADPSEPPPAATHARLRARAHIAATRELACAVETAGGRWHLSAFATPTRFLGADRQWWLDPAGGLCVVHGLLWRPDGTLLDAAAVGRLLDRPDAALPDDLGGEWAVARLHACGALSAAGDPVGLHQLFVAGGRPDLVANRAGFVAELAGGTGVDARAGAWLATIGYRIGAGMAQAGVRQLRPDERIVRGRVMPAGRTIGIPDGPRGWAHGGEELFAQAIAQGQAAIRVAVGDGPLDLPLTGGKDSRAVLALALAAGLKDRIATFTRGQPHSPDVRAGALLAAAAGVPHRREPPLGSDLPDGPDLAWFHAAFARLAFQTEGNMGGWDMVTGTRAAADTLVTGHLGELLKAYAKRPGDAGDPVALVRMQAPFDPLGLLRAEARASLVEELAAALAAERADAADLPDLFYLRHRVPNWLGGIRGVKSFERQPVLPLGAPAFLRLAFRLTAAERARDLVHFRLVERLAPALLPVPFAHQRWHPELGAPVAEPLLAPAGQPLFGGWHYAVNDRPEIRAHLATLFATDLALWNWIDRDALLARLEGDRFDYFGLISLLGITVSAYHAAGLLLPERLAPDGLRVVPPVPAPWPAAA